jgi:tetratricopeptide (TPR) repeat protein
MHPFLRSIALVGFMSACVPALPAPSSLTPADVPRLEAALVRDTSDIETRIALGAAYRAAGRRDEARAQLERALAAAPDHASALAFLGLTYEETGDASQAKALYTRYLEIGGSEPLERELRRRVQLLTRQEMIEEARRLARAEGGAVAPAPRTLAVFPLTYVGSDAQYRPLSRALAQMLVTDLSQTPRLTVLERLQVQALLDEMALSGTDLVDPSMAVRSGRLLGAERVVQGSIAIEASALTLTAAVVGVTGEATRTLPVEEDELERILDAEKRLALALYESLGIVLTVAERESVLRRATSNVQALLAYGEGLEAEDRGDFAAAAGHFARAAELDPGFTAAAESQVRTTALGEAQAGGVERVAAEATVELRMNDDLAAADLAPPPPPSVDALASMTADPMRRDAVAEALGVEGIALRTLLRIVFRRP